MEKLISLLFLFFLLNLVGDGANVFAQKSEQKDDDVALYNSYIDQEYYFNLWGHIGKEQQKILKKKFRKRKSSEKATTESDQKYWKELAEQERKLVHYFQEFYKKGQNKNQFSSEKTQEFLNKLESDPKMSKGRKLAPSDLNQITKENVRDVYGNIKQRRSTLGQNKATVDGIFDQGVKTFNDDTKNLLKTRSERLQSPMPIKEADYNENELKIVGEHLETYPDMKALYTLSCLNKGKSYKDCEKGFEKFDANLEKVKSKIDKDKIATLLLREFKRSELDLIKEAADEVKEVSGSGKEETAGQQKPESPLDGADEEEIDWEKEEEDMFKDVELDFNPKEYEIPMLEGRKGDRFFLSTDKECGGMSKGVQLGYFFTAAILEKALRVEGQEDFKLNTDVVPLFNCIKHKNILSTVKPTQECREDSAHIIGYSVALKRMELEVQRKNDTEVLNDYVKDDLFHTINRYQNTKTYRRFYAHEIPAKAPSSMRETYKKMIKLLGFNKPEGPLLIIYKHKTQPHLTELYRCRLKKDKKEKKKNSGSVTRKVQDY